MAAAVRLWSSALLLVSGLLNPALAADAEPLMRLLDSRSCPGCRLQDADLAQADLRDARLQGAQLQRANLSGARLDGANLRGTDLSFTSLAGASLRGTDLRGAILNGTDLRQADLSGALLDAGALSRSHWEQARGVDPQLQNYEDLHNAGVQAARAGRYAEAEEYFGAAIRKEPDAAISWVARGISRHEQGKNESAAQDFRYAAKLRRSTGDQTQADALEKAGERLVATPASTKSGNGLGLQMAGGLAAALRLLGPIAIKALIPAGL